MKKSLVALATLAAATGAMAQVTISGYFGGSYDMHTVTNANAARTGNTSENRVSDHSSRIVFNVNEDVGGGITALGQVDFRFNLDQTQRLSTEVVQGSTTSNAAGTGRAQMVGQAAVNPMSGGNNHVGLRFKDLGTLRLGRQDIYYTDTAMTLPGGMFTSANVSPVFHSLATANVSRTPNLIWFTSNRINGFEATVGYSTNPLRTSGTMEVENDMGTTAQARKGSGTYLRLNYVNGPLDATVSTIDFKSDFVGGSLYASSAAGGIFANASGADTTANSNQKGTTFVIKYKVSPELQVNYARSDEQQIRTAANTTAQATGNVYGNATIPTLAVGDQIKAKANGLGVHYKMGANNFHLSWAKRSNTSFAGVETADTGSSIQSLAYSYDLSKNTSVGVLLSTLKNDRGSAVAPFYQSNNAFGGNTPYLAGETFKVTSFALRQNF